MGITPGKIVEYPILLASSSTTIKSHYDNIIMLGISPKIMNSYIPLLFLNSKTIAKHYNHLLSLGIKAEKINSHTTLLARNPDTLSRNFNYFHERLGFPIKTIQDSPQILAENIDAFAKKMRMFKLEILGLKRKERFKLKSFTTFLLSSPATLKAKKDYCSRNGIQIKNNLRILKFCWKKLIDTIDKSLSDKEAEEHGKKRTQPLKKRYDQWMSQYKIYMKAFAERRNRRIILTV